MALGLGEGGEQNAPLGRAVIGGLLMATLATFFFVPVVYSYLRKGEFIATKMKNSGGGGGGGGGTEDERKRKQGSQSPTAASCQPMSAPRHHPPTREHRHQSGLPITSSLVVACVSSSPRDLAARGTSAMRRRLSRNRMPQITVEDRAGEALIVITRRSAAPNPRQYRAFQKRAWLHPRSNCDVRKMVCGHRRQRARGPQSRGYRDSGSGSAAFAGPAALSISGLNRSEFAGPISPRKKSRSKQIATKSKLPNVTAQVTREDSKSCRASHKSRPFYRSDHRAAGGSRRARLFPNRYLNAALQHRAK